MQWLFDTQGGAPATAPRDTTERNAPGTTCGQDVEISAGPQGPAADDLLGIVAGEERPPPADRPWIVLNMIASVDGASQGEDERSGSLSGAADRALFLTLRSIADVVLAGAETVRAENYGPVRLVDGAAELRAARGQSPLPLLGVVSRSLRLDPRARFFRDSSDDRPPLVLTSTTALATSEAARLAPVADVQAVGERSVDWARAFRLIRERYGARTVLVEGGPSINGQLLDDGLVDELCVTISPMVVGGDARRIVAGSRPADPLPLHLTRVLEDDGFLFLRYARDAAARK